MAVYVDKLFEAGNYPEQAGQAQAVRVGKRNNDMWSHLWCDGELEELHAFAKRLGLKREWFQDKDLIKHYDLTPCRRAKAVQYGAIESSIVPFVRAALNEKGKELLSFNEKINAVPFAKEAFKIQSAADEQKTAKEFKEKELAGIGKEALEQQRAQTGLRKAIQNVWDSSPAWVEKMEDIPGLEDM